MSCCLQTYSNILLSCPVLTYVLFPHPDISSRMPQVHSSSQKNHRNTHLAESNIINKRAKPPSFNFKLRYILSLFQSHPSTPNHATFQKPHTHHLHKKHNPPSKISKQSVARSLLIVVVNAPKNKTNNTQVCDFLFVYNQ